jgi:O-antigen chain-terminating methyltransferase
VRLWNTLIDPQGRAHLIDFGAISTDPYDCLWPRNVYFAFFIFVWGVTTRTIRGQSPTLPAMASPSNLPEPYRSWSLRLWSEPITAWSFAHLLETFDQMQEVDELDTPPMTAADQWRAEMEQFCEYLGRQQEKLADEMMKMMSIQYEQALLLKHLFERGTADGRSSEVA